MQYSKGEVLQYVQEEDVCRSSYLLEYFGQEKSEACLTCDICRGAGLREKALADVRKAIDDTVTD